MVRLSALGSWRAPAWAATRAVVQLAAVSLLIGLVLRSMVATLGFVLLMVVVATATLDPYTGLRGPRVVATGATNDPTTAVASLERIGTTGARTVLPGHGYPWYDGAAAAAGRAATAGAA